MVRYVFTWNNYTDDCDDIISKNYGFSYCIYGREIAPTSGTPHLQGYCERKNQIPKDLLKSGKIHFEFAKGTAQDSVHYIRGTGPHSDKPLIDRDTVVEFGECAALKQRGNVQTILSIIDDVSKNPYDWRSFILKYPLEARGHMAFYKDVLDTFGIPLCYDTKYNLADYTLPSLDLTKVNFLIGPGQTGKSSFAKSHFEHAFVIKIPEGWKKFRPNYHTGIVIDDYDWFKCTHAVARQLLELEDPVTFNVKNGSVTIPKGIPRIITCNYDPFAEGELRQLRGRVNIIEVPTSIKKSDVVSAPLASPVPNPLLKRKASEAFIDVIPLNKTQVLYRPVNPLEPCYDAEMNSMGMVRRSLDPTKRDFHVFEDPLDVSQTHTYRRDLDEEEEEDGIDLGSCDSLTTTEEFDDLEGSFEP